MMEVTLSVPFSYEPDDEVKRLLEDFRDMVNFFIDEALKSGVTSYAKLRKIAYKKWKSKWDYSTHFCHSACRIATSMLKSWRRLKRKGVAKGDKPIAKKLFMQLDSVLSKFEGDRLRISVRPRKFLYVQLKFGEYQQKFVDKWKSGELRVGEVAVNETKVLIPFRKEVDLSDPKEWIAIDVNEANVTGVSSNPHLVRIETGLRTIHTTYFKIRQNVQKLAKSKPITAKKLMEKYSRREKRRARDLCHKISRTVVDFAKKHGMGIIMENLKGIRRRISYGRKLNRRLHSWNFRKLQFYIEYKASLAGLPVAYLNPKGSSSLCPICAGKLAANGHRLLRCRACGYQNDRDLIACLNLLRMRGVSVPPESLAMKPEPGTDSYEMLRNGSYPRTVSLNLMCLRRL